MNALFTKIKQLDPTPLIALVLTFAVAFMLGQYATAKDTKKHYIVDASKVEVVYSDPYKASTLDECITDDPVFSPDSVPVIEPVDCEPGDKECEKQNVNAGKLAHYPAIYEPFPKRTQRKKPLTNGVTYDP